MINRRLLSIIFGAVLLLLTVVAPLPIAGAQTPTPVLDGLPADAIAATSSTVIDGNQFNATVNGASVRISLLGLNAPAAPGDGALGECFGLDAAKRLATLLPEGTAIYLTAEKEIDPSDLSKDEATPFYVWMENTKKPGTAFLLNTKLVRDGDAATADLGKAKTYKSRLEAAEDQARDGKKGLWKACSGAHVEITPPPTPRPTATAPPSEADIKASYSPVQDPREILTRPFNHLGEKYSFCGSILSIQVAQPGYVYTPGDNTSTAYQSIMQVYVTLPDGSQEPFALGFDGDTSGMYEGSYVCVWGTLVDTMSGTNAFGGMIVNPLFDADYVELQ